MNGRFFGLPKTTKKIITVFLPAFNRLRYEAKKTQMKFTEKFVLPPEIAFDEQNLKRYAFEKLGINDEDAVLRVRKRSIDGRAKQVKVNVEAEIFVGEIPEPLCNFQKKYPRVSDAAPVIVVGAGPAGMFAALRLIELGLKPILLERGKDVKKRTADIADISRRHLVNPDSNYCFGEGGAGTFSDGKLYTRSKKRGDWRRILEIFVAHGASEEILIDAHPHIGTNRLPRIIADMRQSILEAGGEVHFESRVTDLLTENGKLKGVKLHNGGVIDSKAVILATGHSARDIFELLCNKGILIERKDFALGVRVEHRQKKIDQLLYHCEERGMYLPAASYSLVSQVNYSGREKGVFSFCMCPGGFIVPSATESGEVVVNGMSPSKRNSKYANSGIVVAIDADDLKEYARFGALAGMYFQRDIEQKTCQAAGGTQTAPAQLLTDFVRKKISRSLLDTSYQPGIVSASMDEILPKQISHRLREGFKHFDQKLRGYLTDEAQVVAVESRTSSPVRIPRNPETLMHPEINGLFPSGEGAGYAGGIASAAMDGERCAEQVYAFMTGKVAPKDF
jgi:uncharacterized FAD-dependent dehydrogenase